MRVICTGQSGLNKNEPLDKVASIAKEKGHGVKVYHVGDMMYEKGRNIPPGKILNLPLRELNTLRGLVFRDILHEIGESDNVIIDTHATFRWSHGLFSAFDFEELKWFSADMYITMVEDVDAIMYRLSKIESPDLYRYKLKDIMVWREEEILATELISGLDRERSKFYIVTRIDASEIIYRLMFEGHLKKAYLSFPITHVQSQPEILSKIDLFREEMKKHLIAFDPLLMNEKRLHIEMLSELQKGSPKDFIEVETAGQKQKIKMSEILEIINDIDGQIISRDFKLIDQSDMILAYIPEDGSAKPIISPGVMRELDHAHDEMKEIYVIWDSPEEPSVFITNLMPMRIFRKLEEAIEYFK
jgi:adenylate kinase